MTSGDRPPAIEARPSGTPCFGPVRSSPFASASSATLRKAAWASCTRRRISNCTSGSRSRPSCRTSPPDERSIALFKREVHLARQVTHPNVCRIYDVFRHRRTASPRTAGRRDRVPRHGAAARRDTGRQAPAGRDGSPPRTLLPVVRQMAAGLTAAHRVGVVHRDFKSQNVMLVKPARRGRGDARRRHGFRSRVSGARRTRAPSVAGLLAARRDLWHSGLHGPRAGRGRHRDARDRRLRARRRALRDGDRGVALHGGHADQDAIKRLHEPPPSPRVHVPELDPLWEAAILRCLARRPEDRFASASDVVYALVGASTRRGRPRADADALSKWHADARGPAFQPRSRAPPTDRAGRWLRGVRVRRVPGARLGGSGPRAAGLPGTVRRGGASVRRHGRAVHRHRGCWRASGSRWRTRTPPAAPPGPASRSWTP